MPIDKNQSATANAHFASAIINKAADIVLQTAREPDGDHSAIIALQQARDEFLAGKSSKQNPARTYAFPQLLNDLGQYIRARYPAYSEAFVPISEWSRATAPEAAAVALREAAGQISRLVTQRTIMASRFEMMSDKELSEYNLMRKAADFLTQQGLSVSIDWEREDSDGPIDYWGTVDGVPWAFELTQLRKDPKQGYFRKIGHPNSRKAFSEEFPSLAEPLPQIPQGADILQLALNKAVQHGMQQSKLAALHEARYCLVIQNWQFIWIPDWERIVPPDLTRFDAVLVLHQETLLTGTEVWEVLQATGFKKPLTSRNVADLDDIVGFMRSGESAKAAAVWAAWEQMDELNLSDADLWDAIQTT